MTIHLNKINQFGEGNGGGGGGASLFDIKTMANAIVEKGWAFTCKSTRQDLAKASVPTIYNDILDKYNNADSQINDNIIQLNNVSCAYTSAYISEGYLYGTTTSTGALKRISLSNLAGTWETINDVYQVVGQSSYKNNLAVGNNLIVYFGYDTSNENQRGVFVINKNNGNLVDKKYLGFKLSYASPVDVENDLSVYLLKTNSGNKFVISYAIQIDSSTKQQFIATIDDNPNATIVDKVTNATYSLFRPIYLEDENKIMFYYYSDKKIYKSDLDFQNWVTVLDNVSASYGEGYNLYKIGTNIFASSGASARYSADNGVNWSSYGYDYHFTLSWCDGNIFYGVNRYNNLYSSTDFINFTLLKSAQYSSKTEFDITTNTIIMQYNNNVYYLGYSKTIYTDTINGTEVNYYKNGDYKICVADNTNDTALATVYSYMGYYNYYRLDLTNETISLPRNSNLYSMMYVGDNYQDTLDGITGNATRLLPQSEVISDSSASVSLDVKGNKDYQLINSALTSLTITTCEDSQLGTTIQFNSGATATTITDSANIEWVDGSAPTPSADKTCLIFIWNNKGFYKEW